MRKNVSLSENKPAAGVKSKGRIQDWTWKGWMVCSLFPLLISPQRRTQVCTFGIDHNRSCGGRGIWSLSKLKTHFCRETALVIKMLLCETDVTGAAAERWGKIKNYNGVENISFFFFFLKKTYQNSTKKQNCFEAMYFPCTWWWKPVKLHDLWKEVERNALKYFFSSHPVYMSYLVNKIKNFPRAGTQPHVSSWSLVTLYLCLWFNKISFPYIRDGHVRLNRLCTAQF